ncbi:recombinase family protein [Phyllobacterium endophyticum]|uniref:recombinase family protein n=1 Tax=Phyllobacterium endophyticum TaxID=1149773 RepID=UPI0011C85193|nr:recombinase family protein [Phyllobacterium endophyticum]TXR50079.1 recombinase family protein [Phyllobacterium endophyticum]
MAGSDDQKTARVAAAAYVRMSTDHQKYSTENQLAAIRKYADDRGFEIVRVYEDAGRSGLRLDGREALTNLVNDVKAAQVNFAAILAYDVSRWGRFQDADESAYYEYLCSRAGIRVHYCAEQFENDGSIGSNLLKTVKRVMAGEYSRELSVKVFAGQCRLIELGYRQGGAPGFGLRRLLIDENGNSKGELLAGQRKSLQTDRVTLVPGPPQEVDTVKRIYQLFVNERKSELEIAGLLNHEGILSDLGRSWRRGSVHQILTNEKYVGNNVYNRISFKLKQRRIRNKPEAWVRAEGAFIPLIEPALFNAARTIIESRHRHMDDTELLEKLRALLESKGSLSGMIIDEMESMPSSSVYQHRFGSLLRAYKLIEYDPGRDYRYIEINRALRQRHPQVVARVIEDLEAVGAQVVHDPTTEMIQINGEFSVSIVLSRSFALASGALRWKVRLDTGLIPDITLVVRMDEANQSPLDYYLLPAIDMTLSKLRFAERNAFSSDAYRFDSLDFFHQLAMPAKLEEVA